MFYQSVIWSPLWNILFPVDCRFCVFGCIFHLGFCAWHRNLGAHNQKMSLQKFPRMTKKRIKCVHLAILFQIYTGVLSTFWTIRPAMIFCIFGQSRSLISKSTTLHAYLVVSFMNLSLPLLYNQDVKSIILRFTEDVNKRRRTFFLDEFTYICKNKGLVIIAKKFERMQVDFLLKSDVLTAVAVVVPWAARPTASKLSVEFWRWGEKREESLQLRLWNLNICIEKGNAKCWLAVMTLVKTSLPLARLFQRLFTFAFVSLRADRQKSVHDPKWSPTPNDPQYFHTRPEIIPEELWKWNGKAFPSRK